jgi:hypothetical protein
MLRGRVGNTGGVFVLKEVVSIRRVHLFEVEIAILFHMTGGRIHGL